MDTVAWFSAVEHMARYYALPSALLESTRREIAADLEEFHHCVKIARRARTWEALKGVPFPA